jgi:hypothetical protein
VAPILRYAPFFEKPEEPPAQLPGGGEARAPGPEARDMGVDDALEDVQGTVGARQRSNRSRVFIVHFDNGKSKEC